MGRKKKFQREELADAALRIAAENGPRAVTVAAVAKRIGAPTGSFYHRYPSRSQLLAELWMDLVESFQQAFVDKLAEAKNLQGAVETAVHMSAWTRDHLLEARVLLVHHRRDFVDGEWPPALVERAEALEPQLGAALREFGKRTFGRANPEVMARLRFALLDVPFGAIKPYVQAGKPAPRLLDQLIEATTRAVLGAIAPAKGPEASA